MTAVTRPGTLSERVAAVRARIAAACARAGRDAAEVTLIGVSKTQPAATIIEAWQAGVTDFGENYVQEALPKIAEVRALAGSGPCFHFIGHLQRNKAKAAVGPFAILQSVDSVRLLDALAAAAGDGRVSVMLQVNLAGEATKGGIDGRQLGGLAAHARRLERIKVVGLMTVPPASGAEAARPFFRQLRELAAEHELSALSMGMSDDFEVAIEEGATHVRVGRAIFGERAR
jgi:PLP dependent protein